MLHTQTRQRYRICNSYIKEAGFLIYKNITLMAAYMSYHNNHESLRKNLEQPRFNNAKKVLDKRNHL